MFARRVLRLVAVALLLAVGALAGAFLWWRSRGRPQRDGVAAIPGLSAPVEVQFDGWGMPEVTARTPEDLAAALGWLHANDRFFQMELGRRAAGGRLSEIFGARTLEADRDFRVLRLRRTAERALGELGGESRAWLEAYARGVNAWLEARGGDLPPELVLLGAHPEPWSPVDSLGFQLLMANDLSFWNGRPEEERFRWIAAFGAERARELLDDPGAEIAPEIAELARELAAGDAGAAELRPGPPGSNNWAVGPSRSANGHALVANDPHLALRIPGTWFQVALHSPGYEAAGMTIPGLPGVVLGRGPDVAWAFTNVMVDDHDLFFERLDASGERVERDGTWQPIEVERQTIAVKGGAAVEIVLRSTDRGPLLEADPARGLPARSLAWTAYLPQDALAAMVAVARARTVAELPERIGGFVCPAQNLVAGDRAGHLLWTPIGNAPLRRRGTGRFPSPGWLAAYGWDGARARNENPLAADPSDGLLVTANARVASREEFPWLAADYDTAYRAERIAARLRERERWDLAGLGAIQADVVSLYAREMIAAWRGDYRDEAGRAYAALAAWDGATGGRGAPVLFTLANREVGRAIFGDEAQAHGLDAFANRERIQALFAGRLSAGWFDDVSTPAVEDRHAILERALAAAWRQGSERFGADLAAWDLARLQTITFDHPLGSLPAVGRRLSRGPYAVPGSGATVDAAFGVWRDGDRLDVVAGPSMRLLQDAADPAATLAILPGGQSGHPFDPHYDDQLPLYLAGRLRAAPWSLPADQVRSRLRLDPAPR
jgi:acyl-homoserine lactone acylase PvdQ